MPFQKGHKKYDGTGMKKGQVTRKKAEFKEFIEDMLQFERDNREEMLDKIKREKPEIVYSFLAKVCPKDLNVTTREGEPPVVLVELPKKRSDD
jgi:hypothetical protein